MKRLWILCLMPVSALSADPVLRDDVRGGIDSLVNAAEARAVVIGLYDAGETRYFSFGQVSRSDTDRPDEDTLFEIGSISKVFTTLLAESLVAEGKLDWDDTLAQRMPDVRFGSDAVAEVTLAELARHESGLPRLPDNFSPQDPMDPYAGYDRKMLETWLATFSPSALVKTYAYSNLGMGLLGEMAADASDSRFEDALSARLFQRYGMTSTGITADGDRQFAQGFSGGADIPNWSGFDAMAGAGAVVSTASDMLRFARISLSGDDEQLGRSLQRADASEVAYGWHTLKSDTGTVYWHNGGTGGYSSFFAIRPDNNSAVVILSASTDTQAVTDLGFRQVTGQAPEAPSYDLGNYAGTYQLREGFTLSIFADGDELFGQASGQAAFPLRADGEHTFRLDAAGIEIVFNLGEDGESESMSFTQGGQTTLAPLVSDELGPRRYTTIEIDRALLDDYVGAFALTPLVTIDVLNRDGQLFAKLTGQAAYPVFPFEADGFYYKVVDAQLLFERDESGDIVAVVLRQNGEQRAPRK